MITIEKRTAYFRDVEFDSEVLGDDLYLTGYFIRFNEETELWDGVYERVAPESVAGIENADVRCLFNHDTAQVLGRTTNGTLELTVDEFGVYGRVKINQSDPNAMSAYAKVSRGDIDGCSFGFFINAEESEQREDGTTLFTLRDLDVFEVSVVTFPAYPTTEISARKRDFEAMQERKLKHKKMKVKEKLHGIKTTDD